MTKQEIITKAKALPATIESIKNEFRDLYLFARTDGDFCGCKTKEEYEEFISELDSIRKELKTKIKQSR